jgi:5-methylcytosine-specific restriction endonuclease McrA
MPLYGEKRKEYEKKWLANRRLEYFKDKKCVKCDSTEDLQLDHIDPKTKISHRIWSWSKKRREEELKKCQPLCKKCHTDKSALENRIRMIDVPNLKARRLNEEQVKEIRLNINKYAERKLAKIYNVARITIWKIKQRWVYKNII